MRVLAMASQKGGSGKTTLSGHLAVQAQRAGFGPVVLIDIDPQGSLVRLVERTRHRISRFRADHGRAARRDLEVLRQQGFAWR
ncbi:MAG: ParA family protein [Sphingomonas sp.]